MIAKMYAQDAENSDYADGMEFFEKELVQGKPRLPVIPFSGKAS